MSKSFYINSSAGLNKRAKQRHVFCLIKIPLVLTRQTSNASVPEMADSCARKGKRAKEKKNSVIDVEEGCLQRLVNTLL